MHRPHRHRRRIAVGLSLAALPLAGLPAAGSAEPDRPIAASPDLGASNAGENLRTDLAPGTYDVTLITGDQVRLNVSADRQVAVDVMPAMRAYGPTPEIEWYTAGEGVYVIPEDVRPHLDAGLLDRNLFDVEHLARIGFTDDAVDGLPLIVEYGAGATPAAAALTAAGVATDAAEPLPSINGAAIDVDQEQTTSVWESVSAAWSGDDAARSRSAVGQPPIDKIWLDDVATLTLADSVPQIGAPEAWSAGLDGAGVTVAVLDSGIDPNHPDVAGRIVATSGFLGDDQAIDGHGHGTHVATTIAGSGAASDGRYSGVAPSAELVIGKVCDDNGDCPTSAIIAGMEWAARDQDADIINLSLGGGASNGTDPMSQAVDRLSAETGALFVIAAGNDGGVGTVGSPGAADAALTVAAVDKSDLLANFSSRGPRVGDSALKPEIAAPGVGIVAGRAAGTGMGSPVDDFYTAANGTSMATPHVAGAAALLAQQRPDWGGARLKAALIATSHDVGEGVYEVGAGRVDVGRAVDQQLEVSPAVADFRFLRPDDDARSQTLTYHNPTADTVTLNLDATLTTWPAGTAAPDSALTLDTTTLVVPAGGSAAVTVSLDHSVLSVARYSGSVVATAGDLRMSTPVGAVIGDQTARVTMNLTGRGCADGVQCEGHFSSFVFGTLSFHRYDDVAEMPASATISDDGLPPASIQIPMIADVDDPTTSVDVFVERGRYAIVWKPRWMDADTSRMQSAELWLPEVEITEDATLEIDANRAVPVSHNPEQPVGEDGFAASRGFTRSNEAGESAAGGGVAAFGHGNFWTYPSEPVTDGEFLLSFTDVFEAPQVTMALSTNDPVSLDPIYSGYRDAITGHPTAPVRFPDGDRTVEVVDVGIGSAQDYADVDVSGKLVLLEQTGPDATFCWVKKWQLEEALRAGAIGVLYDVKTCPAPAYLEAMPIAETPKIPYLAMPRSDADLIRTRLQDGPVEVDLSTRAQSPYTYYAKGYVRDEVPESVEFTYADDNVMRVDATFHANGDAPVHLSRATRYPQEWFLVSQPHDFGVPTSQVQYVAPVGPDLVHKAALSYYPTSGKDDPEIIRHDVFAEAGQTDQRWNADPWVPGFVEADHVIFPICAGCREGNILSPYVRVATGDPAFQLGNNPLVWGTPVGEGNGDEAFAGLRVYRNGELVEPEHAMDLPAFPYWRVPAEEAEYRVELDLTRYSDDSYTAWEFRSGQASPSEQVPDPYTCVVGGVIGEEGLACRAEPFIFLRYTGFATDLSGRVPAPGAHRFEVEAYRQETTQPQPEIAGLRLWTSYDGGGTWREARVKPLADGRFSVLVNHPPAPRRESDTVTVRAEAWDAEGNRITQTLPEAYTVKARD